MLAGFAPPTRVLMESGTDLFGLAESDGATLVGDLDENAIRVIQLSLSGTEPNQKLVPYHLMPATSPSLIMRQA
jgi:hypothetical protein